MVLIHFAFVAFVVAGGLLVLRYWRLVFLHLPAITWGALVEFTHWTCPLTWLEDWLRNRAGVTAYRGDFVTHYLLPVLYPAHLTADIQVALGVFVIALNALIYTWIILHWRRSRLRHARTERRWPR
ncbi:MAG: DUF2784 domain-containing protein [Gammaproteobacteria bacterium]